MTPESQWAIGLAIGAGVAVVNAMMLPGRDRRTVAQAMGVGAAVGLVVFPLGFCVSMALVRAYGAGTLFWDAFWYTFELYARAAPYDSLPRGAVIGLFGGLTWVVWRVKPTHRPQSGHPLDLDAHDLPHPTFEPRDAPRVDPELRPDGELAALDPGRGRAGLDPDGPAR